MVAAPTASPATSLPATATAPLSPTALPTETATPSPTPAPMARQLTTGGCCVRPFWSRDGSQVRFIDRPSPADPSGLWGVSLAGGEPVFITDRLGIYSADESLVAYPAGGQTIVERTDGEKWTVPSGGRAVIFSPDSSKLAWQTASSSVNFDRRLVEIWVSAVDGSGARKAASLTGGGLIGWFPASQRLLVTRRPEGGDVLEMAALDLATGELKSIISAPRLRGPALSPQGGWLVYQVAFSGDAAADGLWLVRSDGATARRLDVFGAFAWRTEGQLLIIPLEPGAPSNRVLEVDAETGLARQLTDPAHTPFHIAGGDWSLSPSGDRLAFVASEDHNIWVLDLPKP